MIQGTLSLMILRMLSKSPGHGYGIARAIEAASGGKLTVEEGSLYPALHKLEKRGDISAEWEKSDTGRRIRVYTITPQGKTRLKEQTNRWRDIAKTVDTVLAGAWSNTREQPA